MQSLSPRWQRGSGCGSAVGRHSWVHTLPPFPSNHGQGFPAAPHRSTGKAWQVKLGEGCQNPVASDLLSSKQQLFPVFSCSFTAAFPSLFLPLHCTLQDEVSICHVSPPLPLACSLLHKAEGVQSCRGFSLFKAVGRQHPRLDVVSSSTGSSQTKGFSSAISVLEPALPCRAPHAARGASRERERQKGAERIETRR